MIPEDSARFSHRRIIVTRWLLPLVPEQARGAGLTR